MCVELRKLHCNEAIRISCKCQKYLLPLTNVINTGGYEFMLSYIKKVEDMSLNAWPSHQIQIYDGWLLRFSYFYTHRTNSVEQIGTSTIPLDEKISFCENIYRHWGTPCIFKISPLIDPTFDQKLASMGYRIAHPTETKTMNLSQFVPSDLSVRVNLDREISWNWLDALFSFKGTTSMIHRRIVPTMYAAIPKDTVAASITQDNRIVAIGLGILDRDHIGLYAIHVDPAYRRRHYGHAICQSILMEGIRQGATRAYLQVVPDNVSAKNLYRNLGFEDCYNYWFRLKNVR